MDNSQIITYLSGEKLYGDDFTAEEILEWFEDEKEGYAELLASLKKEGADKDPLLNLQGNYGYHALNRRNGYRYLPKGRLREVLSIGGSYGDELLPIISRIKRVTILEPSEHTQTGELRGVPIKYVTPDPLGDMPFDSDRFDLITCFGVLHHIPNVAKVMSEIYRCLKPGGHALIVEPTYSLGDWRYPRPGTTKRERGIPIRIFRDIISTARLKFVKETPCIFSLVGRAASLTGWALFNSRLVVELDRLISHLLAWNMVYHPTTFWQKIRPRAVFFVLAKTE